MLHRSSTLFPQPEYAVKWDILEPDTPTTVAVLLCTPAHAHRMFPALATAETFKPHMGSSSKAAPAFTELTFLHVGGKMRTPPTEFIRHI